MNCLNKLQYDLVLKLKRDKEAGVMYTRIHGNDVGEYILWAYLPTLPRLNNSLIEMGRVILNPNGSTTINFTYPINDRYDHSRVSGGLFYGRLKFNLNLAISRTELIYKVAKEALKHLVDTLRNLTDPKQMIMNIATSLDIDEMIYLDSYEYDVLRSNNTGEVLGYNLRIMNIDDINVLEDLYE